MIDLTTPQEWLLQGLSAVGLDISPEHTLYKIGALLTMGLISWCCAKVFRLLLHYKIIKVVSKTSPHWDDELHSHGFFIRLGHLVPALVIYLLASPLLHQDETLLTNIQKMSVLYMLLASLYAASALLNTIEDLYNESHLSQKAPITGFIQVTKLVLVIIVGLLSISLLMEKSPLLLLSGLTAVAAVLLLIFRDTILGFVAGIQIAANRMVNTGDWLEMPKYGVDGEVLEVGLTVVKIQNWDKTISTLPTYTLTSDSVKNWRGMSQSGGRRIKRAIKIDIQSVTFCDQDMLDRFKRIRFISEYIDRKVQELAEYRQQQSIDESDLVNSRRLTNLGTFRAYLTEYLKHHPSINKEMTLMVRQLPPSETGVSLELYCFSANKNWVAYEGIQADIFDHALAMLPVFDLRAYQRVSDRTH
ncbi:mechanosensitive ion channel family protein [Aestuariibacter salexigens]|uniref:mechanosensitive ion channel family protein n=1 Tax=Aestuariibacter salexigens TaxID=226010 RepID=UPI0004121262|nr:mechanosensitive ion channel family protein [Aestuariibacter salexigens]